jgi:hypothetical protein
MWISVKDRKPRLDQMVLVAYASGHDGSPIYAWGARINEGDGWLWGTKTGYGSAIHPEKDFGWNDIEADDDYKVTHWMPLPKPPFRAKKKSKTEALTAAQ